MNESEDSTIAHKSLLEMATELIGELRENDWHMPFLSQSDEVQAEWHRLAQIRGVEDPEVVRKFDEWRSIEKRHSLWEFNTRRFVFSCQTYLNEFGSPEQTRRLQGNMLWQILLVADNPMNRVSYLKEQCLADLQSMARLCDPKSLLREPTENKEALDSQTDHNRAESNQQPLGERVASRVAAKGHKLESLAKHLRCSPSHLGRICNGRVKNPHRSLRSRLEEFARGDLAGW